MRYPMDRAYGRMPPQTPASLKGGQSLTVELQQHVLNVTYDCMV
jgi:hypothetical protein